MKRQQRLGVLLILILATLLLSGCPGSGPLPIDKHYLTVFGHRAVLQPGTGIELPIMLRSTRANFPISEAQVTVLLGASADNAQSLFSGTTDKKGMVTAQFTVPETDDPHQFLIITSAHAAGEATYAQEVTLGAAASVMVSTDKPVYQPGQTIHVRVLALDSLSLWPAGGQAAQVCIRNPQNITLAEQTLTLSEWGIGSLDFELDAAAATGKYQITAQVGPAEAHRTVEVKPYTPPRFEVNLTTDRPYYGAEETVSGRIEAAYFFGKAVRNGQVKIIGQAGRSDRRVLSLEGVTDEAGSYAFDFPVPDYYFDRLEQGTEDLRLTVTITDTAQHAETISDAVLISADMLRIEAIPESGFLRPGLENIVYLQVSEPDGTPAQAELAVTYKTTEIITPEPAAPASPAPPSVTQSPGTGTPPTMPTVPPVRTRLVEQRETVTTDLHGLATIRLTTDQVADLPVMITAQTATRRATRTINLGTTGSRTAILLRPERAEYRAGETIQLQVLATASMQTVYLDVVKERQTVDFRELALQKGRATAEVALDGSLLGTLEIHVYGIDWNGALAHDRRLVLVNPPPVQVTVKGDADIYRPGDSAHLSLDVSLEGQPTEAALGLGIVDESVFALSNQAPSFIRTYFLLQEELQERRYGIEGFTPFDGDAPLRPEFEGIQLSADRALMGAMAQVLAETSQVVRTQQAAPSGREKLAVGFLGLPLLGLLFYENRRQMRWLVAALALVALVNGLVTSCASGPPQAPAPSSEAPSFAPVLPVSAPVGVAEVEAAPRLRQFFPETLFWLPELTTDPAGHAEIVVPIADSITTWRVSVVASTREGMLGSAEADLRVFQDFFIEPTLPARLTQNDRIEVPVSVYNYLDKPQEVQVMVEPTAWFTVTNDQPAQTLALAANEVAVARVAIQVLQPGQHTLTFTARGRAMSDTVARPLEVVPDGRRVVRKAGGTVARSVDEVIALPSEVLTGTERITVNLYPSPASQIELELSDTLYWPDCPMPDFNLAGRLAVVMHYLKETGTLAPDQQLRGERALRLAYQRLLRYRDPLTGGFTSRCYWFSTPSGTPDVMGSARALMALHALSRVTSVDPALMDQAFQFIIGEQKPDGTWQKEEDTSYRYYRESVFAHTVGTTYALGEAGYANSQVVQQALSYVRDHIAEAENAGQQAEALNALLLANPNDPLAQKLIEGLLQQAPARNGQRSWGRYGLDDTVLIALALLRAGGYADEAQQALAAINVQRSDRYLSDQAEANLARALSAQARQWPAEGTGTIAVRLNKQPVASYKITAENFTIARQTVMTAADTPLQIGDNQLQVRIEAANALSYQVITEYYLPWPEETATDAPSDGLALVVRYPEQPAQRDSTIPVTATVASTLREPSGPLIVEVAIPAGFAPVWQDWRQLVSEDVIQDYQIPDNQQIRVYLDGLEPGAQVMFSYRLWAEVPGSVRVPTSRIYRAIAPADSTEAGSGQIVTTE